MVIGKLLKGDPQDVWTKRSISKPLAKFREFDSEDNVMHEARKTVNLIDGRKQVILKKS